MIKLSNGQEFVRVRNPWGNEQEWKGKWADGSKEWDSLSLEERKRFGLTFDSDGEWWMEYEDFLNNFNEVEMCHLCPEKMLKIKEKVFLDVKNWHGKWVEGVSAGGCRSGFILLNNSVMALIGTFSQHSSQTLSIQLLLKMLMKMMMMTFVL